MSQASLKDRQLQRAFAPLAPEYVLTPTNVRFKFYHIGGKKMSRYRWTWPYVDVFMYTENSTHIQDTGITYDTEFVFPKSITFPLHLRPFGKLWLPAPRDTFMTLEVSVSALHRHTAVTCRLLHFQWTYGEGTTCRILGYLHSAETGRRKERMDCSVLAKRYPFVHRYPNFSKGGGLLEELRYSINNRTYIQRWALPTLHSHLILISLQYNFYLIPILFPSHSYLIPMITDDENFSDSPFKSLPTQCPKPSAWIFAPVSRCRHRCRGARSSYPGVREVHQLVRGAVGTWHRFLLPWSLIIITYYHDHE